MRWNSIRTRFILIQSAFLIFIVGGAALLFILFGKDYYINSDRMKMNKIFENLDKVDLRKLSEDNNDMINQYEETGFRFMIATIENDINILYTTYEGHESRKINKAFYRRIERKRDQFSREPVAIYNQKQQIYLYGIIEQNGTKYYVYLYKLTSLLENEMEYWEKFLILILMTSIIIGGILIFYLTDKITKPIKKINNIANKISQKDFSERIEEDKYYGEIGSLSKSINRMSEQMQGYINDLENYNYILLEENINMTEMNDMRREFVNNMSHELKTPLAIISSQVELIMEMEGKVNKDYYYRSIQEETEKMGRMISEMLEVSFIENGLKQMEMSETNITELTKKLILKYGALFLQKQIQCITTIEEGCVTMANGKYLEKAINNYLLNAYEHTEKGHQINVKLYSKEDEVVLSVYNKGNQIDEKNIDKIWLDYYQQSKSKKLDENQKNFGLGLYIVKSIIDQHHGICTVENKEDGVEFSIRLKSIVNV
jgi:signal transduction histidine kinase